jgi:flagellar FliL protein
VQSEAVIDQEDAIIASRRRMVPSRRFLLLASAALLVMIGLAGGALMFLGNGDKPGEKTGAAHDEAEAVFVEMPPLVVNLRSADGSPRLIKLSASLVPVTAAGADKLKARMPLIVDRFQPFLRELRPEDLAGSAAVFRIKEELLLRANDAAGAGSVRDVLIQDLIQQ